MACRLSRFAHSARLYDRSCPRSKLLACPNIFKRFRSSESPSTASPPKLDVKYNWVDGVEVLENYVPGGYHPIMIGDILHNRYHIIDKLGFGGYSTVWLARDPLQERYVALKVGLSSQSDTLRREIKTLYSLSTLTYPRINDEKHRGSTSIPRLLDEFEVQGPNGTHLCYTTSPARCNLGDVAFNRFFTLEVTRALVGGLTLALSNLHARGYVHGDVHLHNILVKLPPDFHQLSAEKLREKYGDPWTIPISRLDNQQSSPNAPAEAVLPMTLAKKAEEFTLSDARVLLCDFGEAFAPDSVYRPGERCNTPLAFRSPEARFEPKAPLTYSADVWSLATAIWEIIGMKAVFSTDWVSDDEMTAQHMDELGPLPRGWWESWGGRGQFFHEDMRPIDGRQVWPPIEQAFEDWVQKYRRKRKVGAFSKEESSAIVDLMRRMLVFRPEERPTVDEILQSEWMVNWVLPDYERSLRE